MILDTHVVLWCADGSSLISEDVREHLFAAQKPLHVSVASLWEIEIKRASGRLSQTLDFQAIVSSLGLTFLPIIEKDAIGAARLPLHHRDPFDRMILAQAMNHGLTVVTHDQIFARYALPVLWV